MSTTYTINCGNTSDCHAGRCRDIYVSRRECAVLIARRAVEYEEPMKQRRAGSAWDSLTPAERERRLVYQRARSKRVYWEMRAAQSFAAGQRKPTGQRKPNPDRYNHRTAMVEYVVQCKLELGHCHDCKLLCEDWNYCMFAFDHLDPKLKSFGLSNAYKVPGITKQMIVDEIAKCQLVCHNCHAFRTWVNRDHDYQGHRIDVPVMPSLLDCPEWDVA